MTTTTTSVAAPSDPRPHFVREDQTVQTMPDVSPTKWHRAHTTWFFETFVLAPRPATRSSTPPTGSCSTPTTRASAPARPAPARPLTRPGIAEIADYRRGVDDAMDGLLAGDDLAADVAALVELGCNHEQQHQELLLMDIKHVLATTAAPAYQATALGPRPGSAPPAGWIEHPGGA